MDELYIEYGKLMIQAELINNRILQLKQQIVQGLNKPSEELPDKKEK